MLLNNQWKGGKVNFKIPPLPPEYSGASGAFFKALSFDPGVGEETALILLDDPQYSRELGGLSPFDLESVSGLVRTSAGIIAYIIWVVSSRRGHVVDYEHTLNPFDIGTIRLISSINQQTHLKVLIVDSLSSEVVGFFEIENNFGLDQLASGIAKTIGNEPIADFRATQAAMSNEFSLEQLKGA